MQSLSKLTVVSEHCQADSKVHMEKKKNGTKTAKAILKIKNKSRKFRLS